MILGYTSNEQHASGLLAAAQLKGYTCQIIGQLDAKELTHQAENASILIFDLTGAALNADMVVGALDLLDAEIVPPVLYLLGGPSDIEVITRAGSIINQDYSFVPVEPAALAARLEVLKMLGDRRRLTMETAITDRLTGLSNRKYFLRRLEEELYRSNRYNYNVGAIIASMDFTAEGKPLTEKAGTEVVRRVASFFKGRLRKSDIVCRYRWDDFAFLLPDITAEDAMAVAKDVKVKLELLPIRADNLVIKLRVYLGQLCFPLEGLSTALEVVDALEDCCFKAKTEGKADIVILQR